MGVKFSGFVHLKQLYVIPIVKRYFHWVENSRLMIFFLGTLKIASHCLLEPVVSDEKLAVRLSIFYV